VTVRTARQTAVGAGFRGFL